MKSLAFELVLRIVAFQDRPGQAAELVEEILQLAFEEGHFAAEGALLVGVLGDAAGGFHLAGIGLIERVAQLVLAHLKRLGLGVSGGKLGGELLDAAIDFGDLALEGVEFRPTRNQAHRVGDRPDAQRAVGIEKLAFLGDKAEAGGGGGMERAGVGEGIDDDGPA